MFTDDFRHDIDTYYESGKFVQITKYEIMNKTKKKTYDFS